MQDASNADTWFSCPVLLCCVPLKSLFTTLTDESVLYIFTGGKTATTSVSLMFKCLNIYAHCVVLFPKEGLNSFCVFCKMFYKIWILYRHLAVVPLMSVFVWICIILSALPHSLITFHVCTLWLFFQEKLLQCAVMTIHCHTFLYKQACTNQSIM